MYLSIHAVAGALIGNYVDNSFFAFSLGFLSHFFLDILPHYDADIPTTGQTAKTLRKRYFKKIVSIVYFDISLAIIITAALFTNNIHFFTQPIIWGIVGSLLPDIFQALTFFWPENIFLKKFNAFHNLLHYNPKKPISIITGHATQLTTLLVLLFPIF